MARGHPTQGGDDDLTLFRSKANRASGVIFSLAAALIIGWLGVVEPIRIDLEEFVNREYTTDSKKAMDDIINYVQNRIDRNQSLVGAIPHINAENILLFSTEQEAQAFIRAESNYKQVQSRYKTVDAFRLLDFLGFSVPIPWIAGSLSWCLACTFLIFYINFKRQSLFGQLMNARYLFEEKKKGGTDDSDELRDFAGVAPFWLAPVYWQGQDVNAQQKLRSTLGWSEFQDRAAAILSLIFAIGITLIMCRVIYVGFLITDGNADLRNMLEISRGAFTWLLLVDIVLVALLILAVVGLVAWFAGSVFAGAAFSDRRRVVVVRGGAAFIGGSAVGALGLSSLVGWPVDGATETQRADVQPQQDHEGVARGFYLNPLHPIREQYHPDKTPRVHYANAMGQFENLRSAPGSRWERTEDVKRIVDGLVFGEFTHAVELNFLEAVQSEDATEIARALTILEEACDFQLSGKLQRFVGAPPHVSFRLLDLLARVYGRSEQKEKLTGLAERAEALANGQGMKDLDSERLTKRASNWRGEEFEAWVAERPPWTFYVEDRELQIDLPDDIL